jgi:hypothetical protein
MTTVFDIVTVTCFVGLVIAFFQFTNRDQKTLLHFMLAGVLLAVANQLGNHGSSLLAIVLIVAGIAYAVVMTARADQGSR